MLRCEVSASIHRRIDLPECVSADPNLSSFGRLEIAIRKIADHALDFILARLDGPQDQEHIILVSGGCYLYAKVVKRRFPRHSITEVADPMYANVRGFQLLGECDAPGAAHVQGSLPEAIRCRTVAR